MAVPRPEAGRAGWPAPIAPVTVFVLAASIAVAVPRAAPADTGTVEGRVRLVTASSRRLASAGAYPSRVVGLAGDHNPSELANVIVYVKFRATPSAPMRASITQSDEEFVPHLVAVTAGSTVEFPNEDLVFHNVFSLSRAGTFDLGRYPKGRSKSRTFDQPGIIKVFCHLHSQMNAIIRVFDHPYFSIPDPDGHFAIPNVPAGEYEVIAWHERVGEVTLRASVGPGRSTPLAFSLPLTDTP
jgi:plastocyanin